MNKKVMLVIRDGWGYSQKDQGNAILHARKPFDDYLLQKSQQALLSCHGESVGLPYGFQGSSEVGHLCMGAGRIVEQEVTRIFKAIEDRSLFHQKIFEEIDTTLKSSKTRLHIFGLLQDEGVHAHQEHLFQLIKYFKSRYMNLEIFIHCIADGRDTPPKSFQEFYHRLMTEISSYNNVSIASVWGRYYGMDRSKNWELIRIAYRAMVLGEGKRTSDFISTLLSAYENEKTPDNVPMFDEYLKPLIHTDYHGMNPGDIIVNFNYRQDRAIQISKAFVDPDCPAWDPFSKNLHYYGLTQYYDAFKPYFMAPMTDGLSMKHLLGETIAAMGWRQLRIAETQKFRHVTSFFNGKLTKPNAFEDQIEIPSQFDPSSFASHPEMNAADVTTELLSRLKENYRLIVVNYANCDMVGHTGDYSAAMEAARIVDENTQKITRSALDCGFDVIVTADHGNSEEMLDSHGSPKTSHTINPVKVHFLSNRTAIHCHKATGILSDIAPVVLKFLDVNIPQEMTTRTLSEELILS